MIQQQTCPGEPSSCQSLAGSENLIHFVQVKATHFMADAQLTLTKISTCTNIKYCIGGRIRVGLVFYSESKIFVAVIFALWFWWSVY